MAMAATVAMAEVIMEADFSSVLAVESVVSVVVAMSDMIFPAFQAQES